MYRWLMEQGYVLTNPFAGIKVRSAARTTAMEIQHVFSGGEWALSVRDNLRHASISTTSIYLHGDDFKRAKQMGSAFLARE